MTRRYSNQFRAEQAAETRSRILASLADELATGAEASLPRVAERAGVSLRTLHNHFPDEQSRVSELARWIDEKVGVIDDVPASYDDIPSFAGRMIRAFFAHETLLRAQAAPGIASHVRRERRRRREAALRAAIASKVAADSDADRVGALLAWLIGAPTTIVLKDNAGLSDPATETTIVWAVRVLAEAAARGDLPSDPSDPSAGA